MAPPQKPTSHPRCTTKQAIVYLATSSLQHLQLLIAHDPTPELQQFEFPHFCTTPFLDPFDSAKHRKWKDLEPGILQLTLNCDASTGRCTYLQSLAPDTEGPIQNFVHDYVEEIIILEGDLRDFNGRASGTGELTLAWESMGSEKTQGEVRTKGCYAYRKPGMEHGPFRSEVRCLMFIACLHIDEMGQEKKRCL